MFNEFEMSERIKERRTINDKVLENQMAFRQKAERSSGYVPLRRKVLETIMKLTKKKGAMRNV